MKLTNREKFRRRNWDFKKTWCAHQSFSFTSFKSPFYVRPLCRREKTKSPILSNSLMAQRNSQKRICFSYPESSADSMHANAITSDWTFSPKVLILWSEYFHGKSLIFFRVVSANIHRVLKMMLFNHTVWVVLASWY